MCCLKPSVVHPCPGLDFRLKETWYCEDKNSKMQRRNNKTENGTGSCKSATFFFFRPYFSCTYFLPQGRHTLSSKAYSDNDRELQVLLKSTLEPSLGSSRMNPQLPQRLPTDTRLNMNLRQWSLKYSTNRTLGYGAWKEHWRMNACLTETWGSDSMGHTLGEVVQSAGLLALVTLMPSAAHALAFTIPPTH